MREVRFRSVLLVLLIFLINLSAYQAVAYSGAAFVSEYFLSDCRIFRDIFKATPPDPKDLGQYYECRKRPESYRALRDVEMYLDDKLFWGWAKETIEAQSCQYHQVRGLSNELKKDSKLADYTLEKTKMNLARLRTLIYQKKRLELSYARDKADCELAQALPFLSSDDLESFRRSKIAMNPVCKAKRMTPEQAKSILTDALNREAVYKKNFQEVFQQVQIAQASFPFSSASGLQEMVKELGDSAEDRAIKDDARSNLRALHINDDLTLAKDVFNESFDQATKKLPSIVKLQKIYADYMDELKDSSIELAKGRQTLGYKYGQLTDSQKKQLWKGPIGQEFIAMSLANATDENREDVKNKLCRMDARYGVQREKTEFAMDVGMASLYVASAAVSALPSSVLPLTRGALGAKSKAVAVARSSFASRSFMPLNALVGLEYAHTGYANTCSTPIRQITECSPYTAKNTTDDFEMFDCLANAGLFAATGVGETLKLLRGTKSGQKIMEWLGKTDFEQLYMKALHQEKGLPKSSISAASTAEVKAESYGQFIKDNTQSIRAAGESMKSAFSTSEKAEAFTEFYSTGSKKKLMKLEPNDFEDVIVGLRQFSQVDLAISEMRVLNSTDVAIKAELTNKLPQKRASKAVVDSLFKEFSSAAISEKLTEPVVESIRKIGVYETYVRATLGVPKSIQSSEDVKKSDPAKSN